MKKVLVFVLAFAYGLSSMAATKIKTTQDSVSYALGYIVGGQQLSSLIINKYGCDKELFLKAMRDALYGDSTTMTQVEASKYMHNTEVKYQAREENKKDVAYRAAKGDNDHYMAILKTNPNFKEIPNSWDSTAMGVQRRIITNGKGEKPTVSSAVKFNYRYKLTNGTVVSESKPGEPIEGLVSNLLPGLQDALVEMPVGSKWEIVIPSELGFDKDEQRYEDGRVMVPANSILVFEVELINTGTPEDIDYYGGDR
ncbi:MAG: FKBP-type peptidyl-prolyl cis-trans isomerase [Paludibacteraceae bacterium]|nr:FKBP-type peptidyl-prolyl cis-trans isomerase [Paludibacteraceae bacterium]